MAPFLGNLAFADWLFPFLICCLPTDRVLCPISTGPIRRRFGSRCVGRTSSTRAIMITWWHTLHFSLVCVPSYSTGWLRHVTPGCSPSEPHPYWRLHFDRQVCEVYRLHRETYHLALDFIDRYLATQSDVPKQQLQLIGECLSRHLLFLQLCHGYVQLNRNCFAVHRGQNRRDLSA